MEITKKVIEIIPKLIGLFINPWKYRYWVNYGGRSSGKSTSISNAYVNLYSEHIQGNLSRNMIINPRPLRIRPDTNNPDYTIPNPELLLPYNKKDIFDPERDIDYLNIVVIREKQKAVGETARKVIEKAFRKMGYGNNFIFNNTEIKSKNSITISDDKGRPQEVQIPYQMHITFTGLSEVTQDNILSTDSIDSCWVEEANAISESSYNILAPTVRKERRYVNPDTMIEDISLMKISFLVLSFNPSTIDTITYRKYVLNATPDCNVIYLTYRDNPFLPQAIINEIEKDRIYNKDNFDNIWLGIPKEKGKYALWTRDLINDCTIKTEKTFREVVNDLIVQGGYFVLSIDPATTANKKSDFSGLIYGCIIKGIFHLLKDFTDGNVIINSTVKNVYSYLQSNRLPLNEIIWETNQGGNALMIIAKIFNVPIKGLHQSGKKEDRIMRAFNYYKQNRIYHYSVSDDLKNENLGKLEEDMVSYTTNEKELNNRNIKLDRIDALSTLVINYLDPDDYIRHPGLNNKNIDSYDKVTSHEVDVFDEYYNEAFL